MNYKDKIVLFSGRFDACHLGHVCSILRLAKTFGKVKVVILDYPERKWPIAYTLQRFREVFEWMPKANVELIVNSVHFGKITLEEIEQFRPFDFYAAGNIPVLRHVEKLGIPSYYLERAYWDTARDMTIPSD